MRHCLPSPKWRRVVLIRALRKHGTMSAFVSNRSMNGLSKTCTGVRRRHLSGLSSLQQEQPHDLRDDSALKRSRSPSLTHDWMSALSKPQDVKILEVDYVENLEDIAIQCEEFVEEHAMTREAWDVNAQDRHGLVVDDMSQVIADRFPIRFVFKKLSLITDKARGMISERALSTELLASRIHPNANFLRDYVYTSDPPTSIGSGATGDVFLCRRRGTYLRGTTRCVKRFDLQSLSSSPGMIEKLKNEAVIGLSLEHPHIARIYGVYEDADEVSIVMQYCSGGDLSDALHSEGIFSEDRFKEVALQMLLAMNYIHGRGIVHRDIKLRNWVLEEHGSVKLIDFGLGVMDSGDLLGHCGTHGYFAPEVVYAQLDPDAIYTEKVDMWSLGVVFFELVTGKQLFDQDGNMSAEDVLREIREATPDEISRLLTDVPTDAKAFLKRLLMPDVASRLSAREALRDPYLASAREAVLHPKTALEPREVLERFRHHGISSMPARAWSLAVARSPSQVPWELYCVLRDTFKMFEARSFNGTINREAFLSITVPWHSCHSCRAQILDARAVWKSVCGDQDSLSYSEFLAAILPPTDDAFNDVTAAIHDGELSSELEGVMVSANWDPTLPIFQFLQHLPERGPPLVFNENTSVQEVLHAMILARRRYVIVQYLDGRREFFDFMDLNSRLVSMSTSGRRGSQVSDAMIQLSSMPVGSAANCSGHSEFVAMSAEATLKEVFLLITGRSTGGDLAGKGIVRRVPIVNSNGDVFDVVSALDLLCILMRFLPPIAVLKSRSTRSLDQRTTIRDLSVPHDRMLLDAFSIMESQQATISFVSSSDSSGGLGGVVAAGIISVADFKWVMKTNDLNVLDQPVGDFIRWRTEVVSQDREEMLRKQRFGRFNVVSVDRQASLHGLARSMLSSNLHRIFLSSQKLNRIVGVVSARDILSKVLDKVLFNQDVDE